MSGSLLKLWGWRKSLNAEQKIKRLRDQLDVCAKIFRAYERMHTAKLSKDISDHEWVKILAKVKANRELAIDCERALTDTE
jgi:hypothetical protein